MMGQVPKIRRFGPLRSSTGLTTARVWVSRRSDTPTRRCLEDKKQREYTDRQRPTLVPFVIYFRLALRLMFNIESGVRYRVKSGYPRERTPLMLA